MSPIACFGRIRREIDEWEEEERFRRDRDAVTIPELRAEAQAEEEAREKKRARLEPAKERP